LVLGMSFAAIDAGSDLLDFPFTVDRIRTVGLNATYDVAHASGAVTLARIGIEQGLELFNATDDGNPLRSRADGSAEFTNLTLHTIHDRPISRSWSLHLEGRGQFAASNSLLSVSECAFGGRSFGRGYDSGALSGDHCLMGALELRWSRQIGNSVVQVYGFADTGRVYQKDAPVGVDDSRSANSYGGGVRFHITRHMSGNVEVAKPSVANLAENGDADARTFFSITSQF
jgi:hemolysin activation/secretion protein